MGCSGLTHIFIPSTIKLDNCFINCVNLTIYTDAQTKPECWSDDFDYVSDTQRANVVYGITREEYDSLPTYSIHFNGTGWNDNVYGNVEDMNELFGYNEYTLPLNQYSVAGKEFKGWGLEADSDNPSYLDGTAFKLTDELIASFNIKDGSSFDLWAMWETTQKVESPILNVCDNSIININDKLYATCSTANSYIYYSFDGEDYSLLEDGIIIPNDATELTIYLYAKAKGYLQSEIVEYHLTINQDDAYGTIKEEDRPESVNDIPNYFWTSDIKDSLYYTGKAIVPEINVYYGNTLLSINKDYTLKYSNNTNAGMASIIITGKGNYSDSFTKTFTILPKEIEVDVSLNQDAFIYNGKVQNPKVTVKTIIDGKTITLKNNKDYVINYPNSINPDTYELSITGKGNYSFSCIKQYSIANNTNVLITKLSISGINKSYPYNNGDEIDITNSIIIKNNKELLTLGSDYTVDIYNNTLPGTATVVITGRGNFVGSITKTFTIAPILDISKASYTKLNSSYTYSESGVKPSQTLTYTTTNNKIKTIHELNYNGDNEDLENNDYFVTYVNYDQVGTATIIYKGNVNKGFTGTKKVTYKIVGTSISSYSVLGLENQIYTGEEIKPTISLAKLNKDKSINTILDCNNYNVTYAKNINTGTASIIITGINGYSGTIKKTFKISPKQIANTDVSLDKTSIPYSKGGAKPAVTIIDNGKTLVLNKDYTVSYKNNTKIGEATLIIKGRGNYQGTSTNYYYVTYQNLKNLNLVVNDKAYSSKANSYKPTFTLTDTDGKKLTAKTDYNQNVKYTYVYDTEVVINSKTNAKELRRKGEEVKSIDIIPVNTLIKLTIDGINNYGCENSTISKNYRIIAQDISKATITIPTRYYTGKSIYLNKEDVVVKLGKTTLTENDYHIVSYSNNIAKGSAYVTIEGIGNYGGVKSQKFTIVAKSANITIVFNGNGALSGSMKDIKVSKNVALTKNTYKLSSVKFLGWSTDKEALVPEYTDKQLFEYDSKLAGKVITLYAVWEHDGKCGKNAYYSVDGDTLTIYGKGEVTSFGYPENRISFTDFTSTIKNLKILEGITSVGEDMILIQPNAIYLPKTFVDYGYDHEYCYVNSIYYAGTKDDWKNVNMRNNIKVTVPKIYYNVKY